ncbi:hypothetical protein [Lentzea sp.]|uniref:hypothetical protein n=1 Tax=Lentzea sp. TaxID=56099 RepID=UPI002B62CC11|nr:hypothetical protein [Lentzea sp.]HUQ57338.1 hypothetical protein [Lentzea sp.]
MTPWGLPAAIPPSVPETAHAPCPVNWQSSTAVPAPLLQHGPVAVAEVEDLGDDRDRTGERSLTVEGTPRSQRRH